MIHALFFSQLHFGYIFSTALPDKHIERMQVIQTMAARVLPKIRMRNESYTMCLMVSASVYYFMKIYGIIQNLFIYTLLLRTSSSCLHCLLAKCASGYVNRCAYKSSSWWEETAAGVQFAPHLYNNCKLNWDRSELHHSITHISSQNGGSIEVYQSTASVCCPVSKFVDLHTQLMEFME